MDSHTSFKREGGGPQEDVTKIDGWRLLHLPEPALMLKISRVHRIMVRPDGTVGKAGRQFQSEALIQSRQVTLEEPCLLCHVRTGALFILVGNDAARVAAGSFCHHELLVFVEVAFTGIAKLDDLLVLECVLVAVGTNA